MFKKFISLILTAAMMSAVMCAVVSVSATAEEKVTYYFLAPDNFFKTEAGAINEDVGYYYWQPSENAAWPGEKATPAPEVGSNVFKIEIANSDYTGTVIFNAFVDAGNPADPEKAKVAHQTVNIDLEECDYYGMIYVLANDNEHRSVGEFSGAYTTGGNWFSINPTDDNYYKNSYNYTTYNLEDVAPVPPVDKAHHKDDTVTLTYSIGNVPRIGSFGSQIFYNTEVLELTAIEQNYTKGAVVTNPDPDEFAAGEVDPDTWKVGDSLKVGGTVDPKGKIADFESDPVPVVTYTFKAIKDFNDSDMGFNVKTNKVVQVSEDKQSTIRLVANENDDASAYVHIDYVIECPHNVEPIPKPDPIETPDPKPEPDPEPVQNPHTFFFDTGDWNSTQIQFFIWDGEGYYATKDGWTDSNPWGSNKKLGGTLREDLSGKNGNTGNVFESYPVELESDKLYYVIFNDPDLGHTYTCCLRTEAYLDTAYRTGVMYENPEDFNDINEEARFRNCGLGAKLCLTSSGKIQGEYIPKEMDRPYEVAVFVLKYLYSKNANTGENVVTEELLDKACEAFGVTANEVWEVYKSFKTEPKYQELYERYYMWYDEEHARQMIRPTMIGDLDGDYTITSADALFVLRYSVGLEKFDDRMLTVANVNNDESVDSLDSLLILRKSVGLSDQDAHFNEL